MNARQSLPWPSPEKIGEGNPATGNLVEGVGGDDEDSRNVHVCINAGCEFVDHIVLLITTRIAQRPNVLM